MRGHWDDWKCWDDDFLQPADWRHWRHSAVFWFACHFLCSLPACWRPPGSVSCPQPAGRRPSSRHNDLLLTGRYQDPSHYEIKYKMTMNNFMILPPYVLHIKSGTTVLRQIWGPALGFVDCDLSQTRAGGDLNMWVRPANITELTETN